MKILIVEDDFSSRLALQKFLSTYGECHIAVNGLEAVSAFKDSFFAGETYKLVCMDMMMPELDGRAALKEIRTFEMEHGIISRDGAKIVMTTGVDDMKTVIQTFQELVDAYLVKPVSMSDLLKHMKEFRLV